MEILPIIQECYESLPTLPGFFKDLNDLLDNVNASLAEKQLEKVSMESLCETILNTYPKARIEDKYLLETGEQISAIRVIFKMKTLPVFTKEQIENFQSEIATVLYSKMPNEDGWFLKSRIVPVLKLEGIDIKEYGFSGLQDALEIIYGTDYKCENRGDELHSKIYVAFDVKKYIKEGTTPYIKTSSTSNLNNVKFNSKRLSSSSKKKVSAYEKLMGFAIFPNKGSQKGIDYAIHQLADKALKENWYYGSKSQDNGSYPILKNYLLLTFERLLAEDEQHKDDLNWEKKILTTDKNAVFNTGLVDKLYEPIYALFNKNTSETSSREWIFWTFVKSNDREHQILTRIFGTNLPSPAHYYNMTSELVYNIKMEIGSYNWDHFIDHCRRFPLDFLRENGPRFDYDSPKSPLFYKQLAEAIKSDTRSLNRIKNRITDAIDYAIKRVRWNFKTAIPIYYPGKKQISLLLPLALVDEDKIDVALVLEATDSGAYIAHTILTLEMAYTNARLITRPDSDWLTAESISVNSTEEAIEEIEE